MTPDTDRPLNLEIIRKTFHRRATGIAVLIVVGVEFLNFLLGPFGMHKTKTVPDFLFLALLVFYALWGIRIHSAKEKAHLNALFRTPETLFIVSTVLFLLSYLFASTANLSYAQRFAMTHGNLRLAPDSTIQRLNSASRYIPLLLLNGWVGTFFRLRWRDLRARALGSADTLRVWGLPLTLVSALLYALAFPSFANLNGWWPLAYISLVPLILAISRARTGRAIFYGTSFGVVQTMVANFWLGTFSLVSLQFITVIFIIEYTIFMIVLVPLIQRLPRWNYLIIPVAWVAFDWLRSRGFLGYSWGMIGSSQYDVRPLIQIASLTGIWGVTFIVTLVNSAIASVLLRWYTPLGSFNTTEVFRRPRSYIPLIAAALVVLVDVVGGALAIQVQENRPITHHVRVALIQENTDPHKSDYGQTLNVLRNLTNQALKQNPDLVVWSETAFVPNIRRWSTMDPKKYPLAKLVDEFLAYQKSIHRWLVTGNDDYILSTGANGQEIRTDYNASVLFSPEGKRVETYHKIHLVPFTEYFPYEKQLPWAYKMLQSFDVYLWKPGTRHVVFHTPKISFSTPICFEDSFPNDVRQFVLNGAQAIINLSNDYWSLSKVEGKQHYINSLFRAVENRRPLLRATASGLTAYVDDTGRLIQSVPYYKEEFMTANVAMHTEHESPYTRWGDWFPQLMLALTGVSIVLVIVHAWRKRPGDRLD